MSPGGLQTRFAPSFRLIQAHFGLGVLGLCAFAGALVARASEVSGFFFQPVLLGLVHLCVLGWLLPTAIGALHQLVPVVFEVPVRSERLAWGAFALYALGLATFLPMMWRLDTGWPLPVGATALATAVWLYIANLFATLARTRAWSLTGAYVVSAGCYLLLAVTLGALLAWNLHDPFLPVFHIAALRAHAHLAAFGFFGLLIMGVSYRLLEMFLLSHGAPERAGWVALGASHLALFVLVPTFWKSGPTWLHGVGASLAAVGVIAFFLQVRAIYGRRMQRRPEVAWRHTFTSFAYLGSVLLIGSALAVLPIQEPWWGRLTLLYGLLALPGFIGSVVIGQLYKILPFLVWLHRFSPLVGLKKVPTAAELLPERPKRAQYALMHLGLAGLALGVLADSTGLRLAGAIGFAASAALVARNLAVIHARRP